MMILSMCFCKTSLFTKDVLATSFPVLGNTEFFCLAIREGPTSQSPSSVFGDFNSPRHPIRNSDKNYFQLLSIRSTDLKINTLCHLKIMLQLDKSALMHSRRAINPLRCTLTALPGIRETIAVLLRCSH